MQCSDRLFQVADRLGIDESFCPVRAMLGAFVTQAHFPLPDLLICSVGAVCDDFSAIAQRLESLGHSIFWWEIPRRRNPDPDELSILLPGGLVAPAAQVAFVRSELDRVRAALSKLADQPLDDAALSAGILEANAVRQRVARLRRLVAEAPLCPLPALEMLIVDALAIHYCSDRMETLAVLDELLAEVELRVNRQQGVLPADAARIYWVNPVADLCAMNLVEACGGRICGADYLFSHAILDIPEELPPLEALARIALADRMVGPARDRARQIGDEIRSCDAEAVIVSRIPGASHCAWEGTVIASEIAAHLDILVMEIEVPPLTDGTQAALRSRLEALVETVRGRRGR
jgi:hypothetical protein